MENETNNDLKQKAFDVLKAIETGDSGPIGYINATNYTQHNLTVADGLDGFAAALAQLPEGSARVNTARVFSDGDFVFAHTDYDFFGPKIGFDLFRFEDGLIVEHWDNLQETAGPNPSGRSMVDGPTDAVDLDRTDANKAVALDFVEKILVAGDMEALAGFFDGDTYVQHNAAVADGLSGLGAALASFAEQGITMEYDTIHGVFGEGNFVLVVSEGSFAGAASSFFDLFRIDDGKVAEHWDVIEALADEADWANQNGKFGDLATLSGLN